MNRRLLESKTDESIWQKREKECEAAYQEISQKKTELAEGASSLCANGSVDMLGRYE